MKSADQKARKTNKKTPQNYSNSDYNLFNTLLLKAIFVLLKLILLASQFFASPGMGWESREEGRRTLFTTQK